MFGRRDKTGNDDQRTADMVARLSRRDGLSEGGASGEEAAAGAGASAGSANVMPIPSRKNLFEEACRALAPQIAEQVDAEARGRLSRGELARTIGEIVSAHMSENRLPLNLLEQRDMVTRLLNQLLGGSGMAPVAGVPPLDGEGARGARANRPSIVAAKEQLQPLVMQRLDVAATAELPRAEVEHQIAEVVAELMGESKLQLNLAEQRQLVAMILDDMLGLGPLEPLLADETITDILVNGARQVYVERRGKLELADIVFRDNAHVMNIATRIVNRVGRRVDESTPLVDARLLDGSRVNIIIPPLAIDGPSISIRKFAKKSITLDTMMETRNISPAMATVLRIAARCKLNILISGGTGSGKTTLLNALSQMIETSERVVTIEDAAELQLQQPHVVRLETRPSNLEGGGEIGMRELVKNALRMRPDRIILGEIRGAEALDMLQAMNTGHDGSMCTIHANRPREALTRLENMFGMAGINLPSKAVRTQIAAAVNLIVQVSRMRDGVRRITHIMEVVGMEGDVITTQDLFLYQYQGEGADGLLKGSFNPTGMRPHFLPRAEYYGLGRALLEAV